MSHFFKSALQNSVISEDEGWFAIFQNIFSALNVKMKHDGAAERKGFHDADKIKAISPFAARNFSMGSCLKEIASHIAPDSLLVQLGFNCSYLIAPLLDSLKAPHRSSVNYVVVDEAAATSKESENSKIRHVEDWPQFENVELIRGNYISGLRELRQQHPDVMINILWDGSSVGGLSDLDAVDFLKKVNEAVGSHSQVFCFTEIWNSENRISDTNDNQKSITEPAIKGRLRDLLNSLGYEITSNDENSWFYEVDFNNKLKQARTYLCFSKGLKGIDGQMNISPGERFLLGITQRFTNEDLIHFASLSSFQVYAAWDDGLNRCNILLPVQEAFHCCWKDTDTIFELVTDWTRKPIEFRHPYCFYYGHMMAFAKLKLFNDEESTEFDIMFSRGMDPIVVDPSKCHAHPAAPPEWPDVKTLKSYVQKIRGKIMDAVQSGKLGMRALTFALEHERMHQETLMYLVVQQRKADFERVVQINPQNSDPLLVDLENFTLSSSTADITVSPGKVSLGASFRETIFLWDNEYPVFETFVEKPFVISSTPVTVKEFLKFILEGGYEKEALWEPTDFAFFCKNHVNCPATWSTVGGDYYVHFIEKTLHWSEVTDYPVFVSLSEAEAFCNWKGFRVMTEAEYQRALDCDSDGKVKLLRSGGWEWTSTVFAPFPGFEPMPMYPEYSADFFDGSHYVLKGSSPSTHSSMYRDTFRNFYQRQYGYVFAKFRCCKSLL